MWFFSKLHLLYILGFGPKSKNYGSSTLTKYFLNDRNHPHSCEPNVYRTRLGQKRLQTHFWALPSRRRYMTNTHVWEDITQKRQVRISKFFGNPLKYILSWEKTYPDRWQMGPWHLTTHLKSASESVWSINQGLISRVNFTLQA